MESTVHRLDPTLARASLAAGFALLALAVATGAASALAPLPLPVPLALAGAAVLGVLGIFLVRLGRQPDRYAVEVNEHGIRALGRREWVPWSAVMGLRARSLHQRVEILGPAGPTGVALEYQLEGFTALLAQVVDRCPFLHSVPERRFARTLVAGNALPLAAAAALAVLAVGAWQTEGSLDTFFALPAVAVALAFGALRQVSELEIGSGALVVASPLRRREIPLAEIEQVHLGLRASSRHPTLGVWLKTRDGEEIDPLPPGADPFAVYVALRRAVEAARTAPHAPHPSHPPSR